MSAKLSILAEGARVKRTRRWWPRRWANICSRKRIAGRRKEARNPLRRLPRSRWPLHPPTLAPGATVEERAAVAYLKEAGWWASVEAAPGSPRAAMRRDDRFTYTRWDAWDAVLNLAKEEGVTVGMLHGCCDAESEGDCSECKGDLCDGEYCYRTILGDFAWNTFEDHIDRLTKGKARWALGWD